MDSVGYVSVYSAWGHIWMLTFKIMQSRTNPQPTSERIYILYIKSLSKAACHTLNIAKVHNYLAKGVIFFITKGAPSKFHQLPHASAAIMATNHRVPPLSLALKDPGVSDVPPTAPVVENVCNKAPAVRLRSGMRMTLNPSQKFELPETQQSCTVVKCSEHMWTLTLPHIFSFRNIHVLKMISTVNIVSSWHQTHLHAAHPPFIVCWAKRPVCSCSVKREPA